MTCIDRPNKKKKEKGIRKKEKGIRKRKMNNAKRKRNKEKGTRNKGKEIRKKELTFLFISTLCRWLLFCILPHLIVWHTILVSVVPSYTPIPSAPHPPQKKSNVDSLSKFTYKRAQNRVVGFVLHKLLAYFEMLIMLIVSHAIYIL